MRSSSYTTTPSGMSVCVPSAKPTTHPPRTSVRIASGELRVARVPGGALAVEKDREILGAHAIEAREQKIVEQRARVRDVVRFGECAYETVAVPGVDAGRSDQRGARRGCRRLDHAHLRGRGWIVAAQQIES